MPMPADLEPKSWSRYFAVECNNRAWSLSERPRSAEETWEMLNAAHAAAWHWANVGTELHQMRAKLLLARVHALAGHGSSAFALSQQVRAYFVGRDTEAWELALVHAIHAEAAHLVGQLELHRAAYAEALTAFDALDDEEDRRVFRATFASVPRPE